jgi:hypothetical protein
VTPRRKKIALAVAALADAVQLGLFPVFLPGGLSIPDDVLDLGVAIALAILIGWSWRLLIALAVELVPGVALFPSWTLFVATLRVSSGRTEHAPPPLEAAPAGPPRMTSGHDPKRPLR